VFGSVGACRPSRASPMPSPISALSRHCSEAGVPGGSWAAPRLSVTNRARRYACVRGYDADGSLGVEIGWWRHLPRGLAGDRSRYASVGRCSQE
jgi:hypothetical protein